MVATQFIVIIIVNRIGGISALFAFSNGYTCSTQALQENAVGGSAISKQKPQCLDGPRALCIPIPSTGGLVENETFLDCDAVRVLGGMRDYQFDIVCRSRIPRANL